MIHLQYFIWVLFIFGFCFVSLFIFLFFIILDFIYPSVQSKVKIIEVRLMYFIVRAGFIPDYILKLKTVPFIQLQPMMVNDNGYVTSFYVIYHPLSPINSQINIGLVKVLKKSQKASERILAKSIDLLSNDSLLRFERLPIDYYTLGQNEEFYQKVKEQGEEFYNEYIEAMNDVYGNPEIGHKFELEDGFVKSLLKNTSAVTLYLPFAKNWWLLL